MAEHIQSFLSRGGVFMIPIIIASVISLAVLLERGFALRRKAVISPMLAEAIGRLRYGQGPQAIEPVIGSHTVLDRLAASCVRNLPWSKFENTEALQTKARAEISRLERGLVILEIAVGVGPLLGLLGTVSGLIIIFGNVGDQTVASQGMAIARGISEALNTTVAGLVVAIPALIGYSIYTRRVEGYAVELESLCGDLLGKLYTDSPTDAKAP
jgi:biopolymer transport protein ExbB